MELKDLKIEELVKVRTQIMLEGKSTKTINRVIDEKEREYTQSLFEDTSATGGSAGAVTSGGVGSIGMGAVTSPQPSSLAGATTGSAWSGNGGTIGSGDISNPLNMGPNKMYQKTPTGEMGKDHGARTGKKKRERKIDFKALKNVFAQKQDFTATKGVKKVMNFNDFKKQDLNKVTKVKD
jgi:hypothetical protein